MDYGSISFVKKETNQGTRRDRSGNWIFGAARTNSRSDDFGCGEVMVKKADEKRSKLKIALMVASLSLWTMIGFYLGQYLIVGVFWLIIQLGVDFSGLNEALFNSVVAAVCYVAALAIVIGGPWLIAARRTSKSEVGLQRLPLWVELGAAPVGFVIYFITSAIAMAVVMSLVPGFDADQVQEIGFSNLVHGYEYILAFLTLVIIAPIAEEMIFRGYLYGKLKKRIPWWGAAVITSVLFGLAHGQWNVAVDTFVLGMFLSLLREVTGSLWPAIFLHMIKNGIAYYFLFVNPYIINTLGG